MKWFFRLLFKFDFCFPDTSSVPDFFSCLSGKQNLKVLETHCSELGEFYSLAKAVLTLPALERFELTCDTANAGLEKYDFQNLVVES